MRQPLLRNSFKLLSCSLLLILTPGCVHTGLGQARSDGGPALAAAQPVVIENTRPGWKQRTSGRGVGAVPRQATPPDSSAAGEAESSPADVPRMTTPSTSGMVAGDLAGDCDYWIVSSRQCSGTRAPCDAPCCLSYFQCPPDTSFCPRSREAFL